MTGIVFRKATGENFTMSPGKEPVVQTKFRVRKELGIKGDFEIKLYLRSYELPDDAIISSLNMQDGDFIAVRVLPLLPKKEKTNKNQTNQRAPMSPSKEKALPAPAESPSLDPNISTLMNMGFSREDAQRALDVCGGNLNAAVDYILTGVVKTPRPPPHSQLRPSPPPPSPPPPPPPPSPSSPGGSDDYQIQKLVQITNIEEGIVREVYFSSGRNYNSALGFLMSMK